MSQEHEVHEFLGQIRFDAVAGDEDAVEERAAQQIDEQVFINLASIHCISVCPARCRLTCTPNFIGAHVNRLTIAGAVGALALTATPLTTHAATTSQSISGVHYLYAEVGDCPDGISVFKVSGSSLTLVQNIAVGCEDGGFFGAHHLRRTTKTTTGPACLFLANDGNAGVGAGVHSLAINGSTGALSLVSSVAGGSYPTDLLVLGRELVETDPPSSPSSPMEFNSYAIHNDCSLSLLQSSAMVGEVISIAALSGSEFVAPIYPGSIGTYKLNKLTGAITLVSAASAQVSGLDSAAVQIAQTASGQVVNVFTGQASSGPPQVEAAQMSATGSVLPFKGSPVLDGDASAKDGVGVLVSGSTLFQLNNTSSQLAWYQMTAGTPGSPGSVRYGGDIGVSGTPTEMVNLGSVLFVVGNVAIDACQIGPSGVSSCVAATNPFGGGPSALAIL
jgi:hypothetical protein